MSRYTCRQRPDAVGEASGQGGHHLLASLDEDSRRELAEALHGPIQTRLLVAWYRLGECAALAESDPAGARAILDDVIDALARLREESGRLLRGRAFPPIIDRGLIAAADSLIADVVPGIEVALIVGPEIRALESGDESSIPEPVRLVAFRVIQEALSNVYRHAAAHHVRVTLEMDGPHDLTVSVEDDGVGFDAVRTERGLGLAGIIARVAGQGGRWEIDSRPGRGARIAAWLPLAGVTPWTAGPPHS